MLRAIQRHADVLRDYEREFSRTKVRHPGQRTLYTHTHALIDQREECA